MDRWEWTKVGAAIGAALLVMFAGSWFSGQVIGVNYPERHGYAVEGVAPVDLAALQRSWPAGLGRPGDPAELRGYIGNIEKAVLPVAAAGGTASVQAAPVDLGTLLAAADAGQGESAAKVCLACHTFGQGEPNRVGPNLWGVIGRPVAAAPGFAYSPAIEAHGGAWTYEQLDRYLASPARAIPGNKMSFAGIRNPKSRANLLAWLGSQGAAPAPFPPPATPAVAEAPAGEVAATTGS